MCHEAGVRVLVVLLASISVVGCGTMVNQSEKGSYLNHEERYRPHRIYGGVRVSAEALADPYRKMATGEPVDLLRTHSLHSVENGEPVETDLTTIGEKASTLTTYTLLWSISIPLSLVADTIFLPFDAWAQFKRLTGVRTGERQPATPDPSISETTVTPPVEKR